MLIYIIIFFITWLTPTFSLFAASVEPETAPQAPKEIYQAPPINTQQLIRLGALISSVGVASEKLGHILEQENAFKARQLIDELRKDVHYFGIDLKILMGPSWEQQIDATVSGTDDGLNSISLSIDDNNWPKARQEYQNMLDNWHRLDDYYAERFGRIAQDRELMRSWVMWILDFIYDHAAFLWQGEKEADTPAPESP